MNKDNKELQKSLIEPQCKFFKFRIENNDKKYDNACFIGYLIMKHSPLLEKDFNDPCYMSIHCKYNPLCYYKLSKSYKNQAKIYLSDSIQLYNEKEKLERKLDIKKEFE